MAVTSPITLDRQRIQELIEREEQRLNESTGGSRRDVPARQPGAQRRRRVVATSCATRGRSTSSAASARRSGTSTATRCGTSTTASARWSRATRTRRSAARSSERYGSGTHFAAPTEDAIVVGEELARRWGLPKWRYTNSGSESTMDAIRIARGYTGRETIMKIFGSYHGHHDAVMVSIGVEYDKIGDPRQPRVAALRRRHPAGRRRPHDRRPLQRRRRDGAPHRAPRRRGPQARLRDHGGGDDEPRDRAPRARLPRGGARDHPAPRHRPDLRRGQDRPLHRGRRRDRALGRQARHGHARQGARRRRCRPARSAAPRRS